MNKNSVSLVHFSSESLFDGSVAFLYNYFRRDLEPTCILEDILQLTLESDSVHRECQIHVERVEVLAAVRC